MPSSSLTSGTGETKIRRRSPCWTRIPPSSGSRPFLTPETGRTCGKEPKAILNSSGPLPKASTASRTPSPPWSASPTYALSRTSGYSKWRPRIIAAQNATRPWCRTTPKKRAWSNCPASLTCSVFGPPSWEIASPGGSSQRLSSFTPTSFRRPPITSRSNKT
jgi:hypothetical protein